jgi:hypothetical protein
LRKKQSDMYEKEREDQIKLHMLLDSDDYVPYALTEEDILRIKEIDEALGILTEGDRDIDRGIEKDLLSVGDSLPCHIEDDERMVENNGVSVITDTVSCRQNLDPGSRNLSRKSSSSTMGTQQQQQQQGQGQGQGHGVKSRIHSRKTSKCTVGEEKDGPGVRSRRASVESQALSRIGTDESDCKIRPLNRRLGDSYLTNQVRRQGPRSPYIPNHTTHYPIHHPILCMWLL